MSYAHVLEREVGREKVDELWGVVQSGFEALNNQSLFAQNPTYDELAQLLDDESTYKLVTIDEQTGAMLQLSTIHTTPEAVSWVDTAVLDRLYGNYIDAGLFRYYGLTVKTPSGDYRGGLAHIVESIRSMEPQFTQAGVPIMIGLDHSSHNYGLLQRIKAYFERKNTGFSVAHVGSSRYFFVDFNMCDQAGNLAPYVVPEEGVNQDIRARLVAQAGLQEAVSIVQSPVILDSEGVYPIDETTVYTQFTG